MQDHHSHGHTHTIDMPTSIEGLPEARRPEVVELSDGDEFELEIVPVKKQIGGATVRMLAYNGSVPGPTLKVPQGSTITVHVDESRRHGRHCPLARDSRSKTASTARTRRRRRFRSERRSRTR